MRHAETDDLAAIFFGDQPKHSATPPPGAPSTCNDAVTRCDICDIRDKSATARRCGQFQELRHAATVATTSEVKPIVAGFVADVAACRKGQNGPDSEHWRGLSQMSQMSQGVKSKTDPATTAEPVSAPPNPDRWCWTHSDAMNGAELEAFSTRRARLMRWGWIESEAEALAERLVKRDRDKDERASCTECRHFRPGRCGNHGRAGLNVPDLSRDLAVQLQRCPGFTA